MRALAFVLFAACSPEIAPGTYFCGPEELCPDDLACDRTTALCESRPKEFACGAANPDQAGDDSLATAQSLGELPCVSLIQERKSCLPAGDTVDYYTFTVAAACTAARVKAVVTYPIAFQRLVLQLGTGSEAPVTIDSPCPNGLEVNGNTRSCLDAPVGPGTYAIAVVSDGTGTCDNECRFSRYSLGIQITQ